MSVASQTRFGNGAARDVFCTYEKTQNFGLIGQYTANLNGISGSGPGGGQYEALDALGFTGCTGSSWLSDIAPATGTSVLMPANKCPNGYRPYFTRIDVDVQGVAPWSVTSPTSVPYLSIQDTAGNPIIHLPFNALRGLASYTFPDSDTQAPMLLGPGATATTFGTPITTFTYVAATGVITAGATSFLGASAMAGVPVQVVDGTGKGQAAIVTASSATTLTVSPAFTGLDATSVIAVYYQSIQTYTDTTHFTLFNGAGTPYTANVFDNGFNIIGVYSNGVGQVRPVSASSTAGALTLSFALNTAMNTTSSLVNITNESNLNGAIDLCVGDKWATTAKNAGLQAVVNLGAGTSPLGSNLRIFWEGFYAAT